MATDTSTTEVANRVKEYGPTVIGTINVAGGFALILAGLLLHTLLFSTVYEVMDMVGVLDGQGRAVLITTLRFAFEVPLGALLGGIGSVLYTKATSRSIQPRTGVAAGALITGLAVVASVYVPWIGGGFLP